jgi:hypothetical protein
LLARPSFHPMPSEALADELPLAAMVVIIISKRSGRLANRSSGHLGGERVGTMTCRFRIAIAPFCAPAS